MAKRRYFLFAACLFVAPILITSLGFRAPVDSYGPPPSFDAALTLSGPAFDATALFLPPPAPEEIASFAPLEAGGAYRPYAYNLVLKSLPGLDPERIRLTGVDLARRQFERGLAKPLAQADERDQSIESLKELIRDANDHDVRRLLPLVEDLAVVAQESPGDTELDYQEGLIEDLGPIALYVQERTGLPASVILAQAIYESGWGGSNITIMKNNVLGIGVCTAAEQFEVTLDLGGESHTIRVRCLAGTRAFAFDSVADSMLYYAYALLQSEDNAIHYARLRRYVRDHGRLAHRDPSAYRDSVVKLIAESYHPDSSAYSSYLQRLVASLGRFGLDYPFGGDRLTAAIAHIDDGA